MWVVSLKRLRWFWATHPRAQVPLRGWYTLTSRTDWQSFADLRAAVPSADLVGNCTIFNIGGNNYRLIARVLFVSHKVFVLKVMTHAEYNRDDWPTQCGCFQPPPARKRPVRPKSSGRRKHNRRRKKP